METSKRVKKDSERFFEEIMGLLKNNKLGTMKDVTSDYNSGERLYLITTPHPAVKIILYSSIDTKTGNFRPKGKDALRVVMRWDTKNGELFKSIHTHHRVPTIYENLKKTLTSLHKDLKLVMERKKEMKEFGTFAKKLP